MAIGSNFLGTRSQGPDGLRGPLRKCDRCGREQNYEDELVPQDGGLVHADACYDEPEEQSKVRIISA